MNEVNEKETMMRAYWLGILTYEEIGDAETNWFASDEDAEQLEVVRADLIDDYLAKNLTETEKLHFERNFLPHNLEDVILEKSSLEISRERIAASERTGFIEKFLNGLSGFFRFQQIAVAAALLLVCSGLWFIFSGRHVSEEIARNNERIFIPQSETGADSESRETVNGNVETDDRKNKVEAENSNSKTTKNAAESRTGTANRNSKNTENQSEENYRIEKPQILFLTVLRGTTKSADLTGNKGPLILKLTMPGIDKAYKNYRLQINDANDNLVVEQDLGDKLTLKKSGDVLTMSPIKSALFKKNNKYRTTLLGIDENGAESELISYDSFIIK